MRIEKILLFAFCLLPFISMGQNLKQDEAFFQAQVVEFQRWLEHSQLIFLNVDFARVTSNNKLQIDISTTYQNPDSLYVIWNTSKRRFENQEEGQFEERLIKISAFLCDLELEDVHLSISNNTKSFSILISYINGRINVVENIQRSMAAALIKVKLDELNIPSCLVKDTLTNYSIELVRRKITNFILDYYKDKGTFFYAARVDTTYSFWNEFSYVVTCLNKEIISEGYFEFIRIDVVLSQSGNTLDVLLEVQGKYSASLICPKERKSFYKSMEVNYSEELRRYTSYLKNSIIQNIRRKNE